MSNKEKVCVAAAARAARKLDLDGAMEKALNVIEDLISEDEKECRSKEWLNVIEDLISEDEKEFSKCRMPTGW